VNLNRNENVLDPSAYADGTDSVPREAEFPPEIIKLQTSVVRFTDLRPWLHSLIPALKRWAIFTSSAFADDEQPRLLRQSPYRPASANYQPAGDNYRPRRC